MKYLLLLILLVSCNPIKQVLGDKDKLDKVAVEVIRRGYCINDTTVVEKIRDSIVFKDSIIEVINNVPCKDFDTTIGKARIQVSSGVLTYSAKDSTVYKIKIITNTVRDRALENILQQDIDLQNKVIDSLKATVRNSQTENIDVRDENKWMKIKFWLLFVITLAIIFRKQLLKLVGGFI